MQVLKAAAAMGTRANGLKTQRYTVIAVMHLKLSLFLVVIAAAAAKKPRYNEIVPNKVGRVAEVTSKQSPQSLTCYDNYDGRGDSLQMYDYAPTLFSTEVNFNNRFSSCCFSGVWLLYDNPFYNQGAFFVSVNSALMYCLHNVESPHDGSAA